MKSLNGKHLVLRTKYKALGAFHKGEIFDCGDLYTFLSPRQCRQLRTQNDWPINGHDGFEQVLNWGPRLLGDPA